MRGNRKRRAIVIAFFLVLVLGTAAYVVGWQLRFDGMRDIVSHQANRYLRQQLGPGASVQDIAVGWSSIHITNLRIPLDDRGSHLLIPRAEAGIRPLDAVSLPKEFGRALRSVRIHRARLVVAAPGNSRSGQDQEALLRFQVPSTLYSALARFDSVGALEIDGATISYVADGQEVGVARDVELTANRTGSATFTIAGTGRYLSGDGATFWVSGQLSGSSQTFHVATLLNIPPGTLAYVSPRLDRVHTTGGTVSATVSAVGDSGWIILSSAINDVKLQAGEYSIRIPRIRISSEGDALIVDTLNVDARPWHAYLAGRIDLRNGDIDLHGRGGASVPDTVNLDFQLCGKTVEPRMVFRTPRWRLADQQLADVSGELIYDGDRITVAELVFHHTYGRGGARGYMTLDSTLAWHGTGRFVVDSAVMTRSWRPRFAVVEFDATGGSNLFHPRISLRAQDGSRLAEVVLNRQRSEWTVDLVDLHGDSSSARIAHSDSVTRIVLENGQVLLASLLETPAGLLDPFAGLHVTYAGNSDSGEVALQTRLLADSVQLLPRVLQEIAFTGRYRRQPDDGLNLSGEWVGLNGEGEPFHGAADVDLLQSVLSINHLLVDEAGTGTGAVDFAHRHLSLDLNISDVPFDRIPLIPSVARSARINGRATGVFSVYGDFDSLQWIARMSVAEGTVLGVPQYWINLDAAGKGPQIDLHRLEVGRDIRRILTAEGWVNVRDNRIAITAETGAARAEDLVLALTGKSGILSGSLDARAAISGDLKGPDIEADCRVSEGLLLNEIHFTSLDILGQVLVPVGGTPLLRLSRLELIESGRYAFSGYAESGIKTDSPLRGHLHGGGDLLNLVDQLDRSFHSTGSFGGFSFDLGGTLGNPKLSKAYLNLENGRFTYSPATPATVTVEIAIAVGESGTLERGQISMRNGDQALFVRAGASVAAAYPRLRPIVLTGLGANLGVIEIQTSAQGMPVRLPGLMKPEWVAQLLTGVPPRDAVTISLRTDSTLLIAGDIDMRNGRVTFPFVETGGGPMAPVTRWLVDRLEQARWEVDVHVGSGNHYIADVTGLRNSDLFAGLRNSGIFSTLADYLDHLSIDAVIEPSDTPLRVRETVADTSFHLVGRLSSTSGRVEYLDQQFRIDYAYCEFDEADIMPVLEGRASTFGMDSLGQRVPVYLTMYVIDRETQTRQRRGRLDDLTFVLEDGAGSPAEEVLALLGYDLGGVSGKAQQLVTSSVVRAFGRRWLDPIERRIERWTLLDEITISPAGGRSVSLARLQRQRTETDTLHSSTVVRFFTGSQLTVGKYLTSNMFVTYTGELAEAELARESGRLSLVHLWNLEYRIKPLSPDLVLDFAVEYDEFERRRDESVSLKYSFALEP